MPSHKFDYISQCITWNSKVVDISFWSIIRIPSDYFTTFEGNNNHPINYRVYFDSFDHSKIYHFTTKHEYKVL
ncbi:unnamed protein product [Schistosoma rodhaini]|uniref:Uncharacterized protein n=1 Tax=Schistosoma rodhaini TaxID=6188 RepID=A0AA85FQE6_9TREM|nr:unnamed protein product [Schistosoma rodhaini]